MGAENLSPTGIRSLDRPARNEWLYRLSYPGPPEGPRLDIKKRNEKNKKLQKDEDEEGGGELKERRSRRRKRRSGRRRMKKQKKQNTEAVSRV